MQLALHTTSPTAIARAVEAIADAQLEKLTGAESLEELSFATLLEQADEASEVDDWNAFDDIEAELRSRREEASTVLARLFREAITTRGTIPMTSCGALKPMDIAEWVHEWAQTNDGRQKCEWMLFDADERERVIRMLAAEYAREHGEDLLRAGWTE